MFTKLGKHVGVIALLAGLFVFAFLLNPQKAAAASCDFNGQDVNVEVWVKIVDRTGKLVGYSSDFTFNVTASAKAGNPSPDPNYPSQYWPQNDLASAIRTSGGSYAGPSENISASGKVHSCSTPSDGTRAGYDFTNGSNGNYILDCLGGDTHGTYKGSNWANPEYSASFTFKMLTPGAGYTASDGAFSSSWKISPTTSQDLNFAGPLKHVFTFTLRDWVLAPNITASDPTPSPGQKENFTFSVKNNGPDTADYDWLLQLQVPGGSYTTISGKSGSVTGVGKGSSNPSSAVWTYTIPSTAKNGDQYCVRIYATDGTGPKTAAVDDRVCVKVSVTTPQSPTVSMTCTNSSGTYTLSGSAKDPDKAGALSISYTKDGAAIPASPPTTSSTGAFSMVVTSYMNDGVKHTFVVTAKGINAAGTADGKDGSASATCNPPAGKTGCNNQNMRPVVAVPQAPVPNPVGWSGPSAPATADTTTPNQQYAREVPGDYQIDKAYDQYSPATSIDWTPKTRQASNQFTLNYDEYENKYPYDVHNTRIEYHQYYAQTLYKTSSTPDRYSCDRGYGGPQGSSTCSYTGTASHWSCPSGYVDGTSPTCSRTVPNTFSIGATPGCSGGSAPTNKNGSYSCPSGQSVTWSCPYDGNSNPTQPSPDGAHKCTYTHYSTTYKAGTADRWTCQPGSTGGGSSSGCSYPATAHYNWHTGASSEVSSKAPTFYDSPVLEQCYDRQFRTDSGAPTAATAPTYDPEDPYSVTFQGTVGVDFMPDPSAPAGSANIHQQNSVTLQYDAHYYYRNPDGSTGALPNCNDDNNVPITVTSTTFSSGNSRSTSPRTCSSSSPYAPPIRPGGQICVDYTFTPTGSSINRNGTITNNDGGSVTVTMCGSNLANYPYAHFFGLDVSAGGAFATGNNACSGTPMGSGNIKAFVKGSGALTRGTSTQFAALARNNVSGFGSASLRTSAPTATNGLTFANSGTLGHLGTNPCFPDYLATIPTAFNTATPNGSISGAYSLASGSTIGGMTVNNGVRLSIYVSGDLSITGDIVFSGANGGWATVDDIPSFYVYASGNIYIGAGVRNLDGVYIAQSNTAGKGMIDTCANGFTSFAASALYNNCNSQLRVTGSFIAQKIKFHRAFASLRNSLGGERPITSGGDCEANGDPAGNRTDTSYDCGGEVFNVSPELFLSKPSSSQTSGPSSGKYDYITSLSPVL